MGRIRGRIAARKPVVVGLAVGLAVTLGVSVALVAPGQAVPANAASAAVEAKKPTKVSKMFQGTTLKADPSYTQASEEPICSAKAFQSMQDFQVTGGNTIALVIPLVQDDPFADVITTRADTPNDECIATAIRNARSLGLRVVLKPLLEFKKGFKASWGVSMWRGHTHPKNPDKWQTAWNAWMLRLDRIAAAEHADTLIIGTEMMGVVTYQKKADYGVKYNKKNPKRFTALVKTLKKAVPSVKIAYSPTDTETKYLDKTFVRSLDSFGFTWYPHLKIKGELTVKKLKAAMQKSKKNFDRIYKRFGKRKMTIFEFGFRSRQGTHEQTADGVRGGVVDLEEQQMLYEAAYQYFDGLPSYINGVYTWLWETDPNSGGPKMADYTVQNKPAEATQAKWFGGEVPQTVRWVTPTDNSTLSKDKSFIKVRLYDLKKWPAGSYTTDYKFNDDRWTRMTLVKDATPFYHLATIYPSQLPKGTYRLTVQMKNTEGKVVGLSSVTVKR